MLIIMISYTMYVTCYYLCKMSMKIIINIYICNGTYSVFHVCEANCRVFPL